MSKLLQSPLVGAVVGAVCYLGVLVMTWNAAVGKLATPKHPVEEAAAEAEIPQPPPSWSFNNAEVEQLLQELREQKASLSEREKQLAELSARIQAERQELTVITQAVVNMQKEFDQSVLKVREEEALNLKKLAKLYSAMDPLNAAPVLKQLDDSTLIKIFMYMKDTVTSPLLETMSKGGEAEAKRVALISEKLRLAVNPPKPPSN